MKRIYIYIAMFLAGAFAMKAQNLDPTVEVRRAYEGKLLEAHKPQIGMTIPDSLMRFDLDFDYSVFDNPYKGSYEFNPYRLAMAPARSSQKPGKFHLRAGVGYELHPVLDVVWSPVRKDRFRMDVYATHRSFIGNYRDVRPLFDPISLPESFIFQDTGNKNNGYDLNSEAGFDMRYDWRHGRLDFGASYYGIAQNDWIRKRGYDAVDISLGVSSKSDRDEYFMYDLRAAYRFAEDKISKTSKNGKHWLGEHNFEFDAVLGQVFGPAGSLLFDVGVDMASYHGLINTTVGNFHIVPHYKLERGWFLFDIGVRVSALVPNSDTGAFKSDGQYVYPDVTISVNPIKDAMKIYFHAGGGEKINTLSSILHSDRHYCVYSGGSLDNVVERFSGVLGVEGRISTRFGYHLRGGYVNYANACLDGVSVFLDDASANVLPFVVYGKYSKWFLGLDWNWKAESIEFNGNVLYNGVLGLDSTKIGFASAPFQGNVSFTYNWKKRIFVGLDCEWATSRNGYVNYRSVLGVENKAATIPGYADLGINFEYAFNRKLSLWARGGNLLNQAILRSPLYAEGGINFTAGICLNL